MWEISDMAAAEDLRGRALYDALAALRPAELGEAEWATSAGLNRGFFYDLKTNPISPKSATLRKLLAFIGRTEEDLYAVAAGKVRQPSTGASPRPSSGEKPDMPPTIHASSGEETVEIILLDLSLPMGPGATVDDYIEETPLRFDLGYIRAFTRTPPHRLRLARGVGDSMLPTLNSSDLVWIDSTQTMLNQQDRVWAVSINGAAAIKRLRALKGGKVLVISDNPTIDNYEVDADELLIGGRVIRFARDL